MRLKDQIAIVTGAASGGGKEIARTFVREGAKGVIADLDPAAAKATAAELGAADRRALGGAVDASVESRVEAGIPAAAETFGRIDILVSNAGIQTVAPLELKFADWKKLLAIHLDGGFLTTRGVLRHRYNQGNGDSIIYMGSVHSKEASLLKAPYVTAKHGHIGLAKTIAEEGAKHKVRDILGMAHRGRLNVRSKPHRAIFNEFKSGSFVPDEVGGAGDVKYRLGASSDREFDGRTVHPSLTSHLEVSDPGALGKVRAKRDQNIETVERGWR